MSMQRVPAWRGAADAWFKLLAAAALAYVILAQLVSIVRSLAAVSVIAIGSVLLAYFVYPAVARVNRRLPLWAALSLVYVAGALAIGIAFLTLIPAGVSQLQDLARDAPAIERSALGFFHDTHNPLIAHLSSPMQHWVAKLPDQITADAEKHASVYAAQVLNALTALVAIAAFTIAVPVISIYMLAESATIKQAFVRRFRPSARRRVVKILTEVDSVIGGFVRGQVIVAAVVGVLSFAALMLLHVPYALLIALWAGVMDVIPYIGPFAGGIPAVIIALLFNGAGDAIGVVIAFTLINQLEAHLLGPRIVGSTVKITPLTVIFALLIGAKIFGFIGLLVAVPIAGVGRVIVSNLLRDDDVTNAQLKPGLTRIPRDEVDPRSTEV